MNKRLMAGIRFLVICCLALIRWRYSTWRQTSWENCECKTI